LRGFSSIIWYQCYIGPVIGGTSGRIRVALIFAEGEMMKLHIYEHCPFSTRARMIFGLKAIPVEISIVMEGDAETPRRLVGKKVVPILEKDDGTAMAESMDIVRYVDDMFAPKLLTEPVREEIEAWCQDARSTISKLAIPRMTKSSFAENATDAARQAYREREQRALGDLEALIGDTPRLVVEAEGLLARLELIIGDWKAYSVTDLVLYSNLRALSIVKDLKFGPKARRFAEKMAVLGGVPLLDDRAI
jgi:glutaredoxin 2